MLTARSLSLTYGSTEALVDASVSVEPGEIVALTGSSGSGKTSMLYCLAGLVRPTAGQVVFEGSVLGDKDLEQLAALRRERFGFVFQFAELVPELTLRENVSLPLELLRVPRARRQVAVSDVLERLGLSAHADRRPGQVSGGQAQRAAVARALVHRPAVVFADEPTGSLDSANGAAVLDLFLSVSRESDSAVVLVTHDAEVAGFADRQLVMRDGRTEAHVPC